MNALEFNIYSNALIRITELILRPDFNEIRYGKNQYLETKIQSFVLDEKGMYLDWVTFDRNTQKFTKIGYKKFNDNDLDFEICEINIPPFIQSVLEDLYE